MSCAPIPAQGVSCCPAAVPPTATTKVCCTFGLDQGGAPCAAGSPATSWGPALLSYIFPQSVSGSSLSVGWRSVQPTPFRFRRRGSSSTCVGLGPRSEHLRCRGSFPGSKYVSIYITRYLGCYRSFVSLACVPPLRSAEGRSRSFKNVVTNNMAGVDGDRAQVHLRGVHHPRVPNKGRRVVHLGAAVQRAKKPLQPTQGTGVARSIACASCCPEMAPQLSARVIVRARPVLAASSTVTCELWNTGINPLD